MVELSVMVPEIVCGLAARLRGGRYALAARSTGTSGHHLDGARRRDVGLSRSGFLTAGPT
jgi:hypothetical protein